jgi:hypothetical protein
VLTGLGVVLLALVTAACAIGAPTRAPTHSPAGIPSLAPASAPLVPVPIESRRAGGSVAPSESSGAEWALITDADLRLQNGEMQDVTAGGPGFVAVGGAWDDTSQLPVAGIWTSPDGRDWRRIVLDGDAGTGHINAIARIGEGFVAVGSHCCPDRAAVWTSTDGETWERAPEQESFAGAAMTAVTEWAGGIVAVGCEAELECGGTAIWTSHDGATWERVVTPSELASVGHLSDITASGSVLVAVGTGDPFAPGPPAVFVSLDGETWTRAEVPAVAVSLAAVTAGRDVIVAAGATSESNGSPTTSVVLISADGAAWEAVQSPTFRNARIADVGIALDGVVLVGGTEDGAGAAAAAWMSSDVRGWDRDTPGPPGSMEAVATGPDGLVVAVGRVADGETTSPGVWVRATE